MAGARHQAQGQSGDDRIVVFHLPWGPERDVDPVIRTTPLSRKLNRKPVNSFELPKLIPQCLDGISTLWPKADPAPAAIRRPAITPARRPFLRFRHIMIHDISSNAIKDGEKDTNLSIIIINVNGREKFARTPLVYLYNTASCGRPFITSKAGSGVRFPGSSGPAPDDARPAAARPENIRRNRGRLPPRSRPRPVLSARRKSPSRLHPAAPDGRSSQRPDRLSRRPCRGRRNPGRSGGPRGPGGSRRHSRRRSAFWEP